MKQKIKSAVSSFLASFISEKEKKKSCMLHYLTPCVCAECMCGRNNNDATGMLWDSCHEAWELSAYSQNSAIKLPFFCS